MRIANETLARVLLMALILSPISAVVTPTTSPTVSSRPSVSANPTRSNSPSLSSRPTASSSPSSSSAPSISTAPSLSSAPSLSAHPSTSTRPTLSGAPSVSGAPTASSAPSKSSTPTASSAPSTSSVPTISSAPSKSSTPTVSSAPSTSSVPTTSSAPSKSSAPSQSASPSVSNLPTLSTVPTVSSRPTVYGPTESPTLAPTLNPTLAPTVNPTINPTKSPEEGPTTAPSLAPTLSPTITPSLVPTLEEEGPTESPTLAPTIAPSLVPTLQNEDTESPTSSPTPGEDVPTATPTEQTDPPAPTASPTDEEALDPTLAPMGASEPPTDLPTIAPSTPSPTTSNMPSNQYKPSSAPSVSLSPSYSQSDSPSASPTYALSNLPSIASSLTPSDLPSMAPSTLSPTISGAPTVHFKPSSSPSISVSPSYQQSQEDTELPTFTPTYVTDIPSSIPSIAPTPLPTTSSMPTNHFKPSSSPSTSSSPSLQPSIMKTKEPTPKPVRTRRPVDKSPPSTVSTDIPTSPPVVIFETTNSPTDYDDGIEKVVDGVCLGPGQEKSDKLIFDEESVSTKECKDEADPWRTCIWRTTSVEKCDRMVKAKPYVDEDETLIQGTMTLTLSQSRQATSCKNIIQMEKLLLTYLADNVGNDDRFQIACVYTMDNAREGKELSSGESVESTALEYKLTFIEKNKQKNRLFTGRNNNIFHRRLAKCSGIDKAMCCSQYAINGDMGEYCSSIGCGPKYCGSGRRKRKRKPSRDEGRDLKFIEQTETNRNETIKFKVLSNTRSKESRPKPIPEPFIGEVKNVNPCIFYGELTGVDWNDSVRTYSEFKPQASRSLLDVGNAKSVSLCNCNRYSIDAFDDPALSCSDYYGENCPENEDLVAESTPVDRMTPLKIPLYPDENIYSEEEQETEPMLAFDETTSERDHFSDAKFESVIIWEQGNDLFENSGGIPTKRSILSASAMFLMSIALFR